MLINFSKRFFLVLLLAVWAIVLNAQQNRLMYHLYDVPESSLLNPAVPMPCGWVIGLPVISSLHFNFGNNFITPKKVLIDQGNGSYDLNYYNAEKYLRRRNFTTSEFHVQWLALGLRKGDWSYFFNITEKINASATFPRDMALLMLNGNAAFIGKEPKLNGTGFYYNYYREYAFSISKKTETGNYIGMRAKLLFGKLNAVVKKSDLSLATANTTYNIAMQGDVIIKTTMPAYYVIDPDNPQDPVIDSTVTPRDLLMNTGNPGAAFDFGWIHPVDEQLTLSASLIDLGFIRWRMDNHNYRMHGTFYFDGFTGTDWNGISNALADSIQYETTTESYTTFLPTKLMAGAHYKLNRQLATGAMGDLQFYRNKWVTGITVSGEYAPFDNLRFVSSLSYQYNTLRNLGFGIVGGNSPIQFYALTDNVAAFFWPYGTRNVNLRFGVNIIPGCHEKKEKAFKMGNSGIQSLWGNCSWAGDQHSGHKQKKVRK